MPADVVEGIDRALSITGNDEVEASDLEVEPVACVGNSDLVGDELPPAREYSAPLELVHLMGGVPARRQGPDGRLLGGLGAVTR